MPAIFARKYATASHIFVPLRKRGVMDYAVGADWTPAAGDVKVSIDGGAVANIGTLPTAIAAGNTAFWDFTIATGEVTGKKIMVTISDSATKVVEDDWFVIETYGHASAEYLKDLGADVAQTGDTFPLASTEIADIKTKTDQLTFGTANRVNAQVFGMEAGTVTAAAVATNAIDADALAADALAEINATVDVALAEYDGPTAAELVTEINSVQVDIAALNNLSAAAAAAAVWDAARAGHVAAGSFGQGVASVQGPVTGAVASVTAGVTVTTNTDKTGYSLSAAGIQAIWDALTSALTTVGSLGKLLVDNVNTTISSRSSHVAADVWAVATRLLTAGTNIVLAKGTGITGFNDVSAAAVNAEVDQALLDYDGPTSAELVTEINAVQADIAALHNLSVEDVWDEALAGHLTTGSTGAALNGAGSAGDPWATAVPGAYGAGTAGQMLGTTLNATVGSRASQASVDDIPTNAELATALAALNNLSASQVNSAVDQALLDYDGPTSAELVTEINAVQVDIAALNNLSAAGVRTAVGLATANLDTQLADLPTHAALATALGTADDAVLAAIAALNNLSSAGAQAAAAAALTAYGAATGVHVSTETTTVTTALSALNDLSTADVKAAMVDALVTDVYTEPAPGAPPESVSLALMWRWLYFFWKGKKDNNGLENKMYSTDGTTVMAKQSTTETAGTVTKGAWTAP